MGYFNFNELIINITSQQEITFTVGALHFLKVG